MTETSRSKSMSPNLRSSDANNSTTSLLHPGPGKHSDFLYWYASLWVFQSSTKALINNHLWSLLQKSFIDDKKTKLVIPNSLGKYSSEENLPIQMPWGRFGGTGIWRSGCDTAGLTHVLGQTVWVWVLALFPFLASWEAVKWLQVSSPAHSHGRYMLSSRLLVLTLFSPRCCNHLGNEIVNEISLFLSAFQN